MAATSTEQGRDTEDREDTEDILAREGERSEEGAAAGNTDDYDEISTVT